MIIKLFTLFTALASLFFGLTTLALAAPPNKSFEVTKTQAEWQQQLSNKDYKILRQAGTERPFTSGLLNEKRAGAYLCKACGHELFSSAHKYDSGTGWPSYYQPALTTSVGSSVDHKLGYPRTEIHCARCGSHLGHVFKDGPKPTGLRYCINGAALNFTPR